MAFKKWQKLKKVLTMEQLSSQLQKQKAMSSVSVSTPYVVIGESSWKTKRPLKINVPDSEHYVTALELMIFLDNWLSSTGIDVPVVFRDENPSHRLLISPVKYYGPVNIVENDVKTHMVFDSNTVLMFSDVNNPFPDHTYLRDPEDGRDAE